MVVLGILWVPFIRTLSSQMFVYLQSVSAYISPPIAVVFLFGVFWPRANKEGAVTASRRARCSARPVSCSRS